MYLDSCCLHIHANVNLYVCIRGETLIVRSWLRLLGDRQVQGPQDSTVGKVRGRFCVAVSGEAASFLLWEVSLVSKTFA